MNGASIEMTARFRETLRGRAAPALLAASLLAGFGAAAVASQPAPTDEPTPCRYGMAVSLRRAESAERPPVGICGVDPSGPAGRAGVEVGDRLLEIGGEPLAVDAHSELLLALARACDTDDGVVLTLERNGRRVEVEVTPVEMSQAEVRAWRETLLRARERDARRSPAEGPLPHP